MAVIFVPTPLGNLADVTLRALSVLRDASLVLAEDSRVARRLLSAHDIRGKTVWTYNDHRSERSVETILARAATETIAVTTDAGTPGISDPGSALVRAARLAGIAVEVLPGPCAFVPAAVLSGFDLARGLRFAGFVPRAATARREALATAAHASDVTVFYEAPHRIRLTLDTLAELAPRASCFVLRELSKRFEEHLPGTAGEIAERLEDPPRGEFVLVLAGGVDRAEMHGNREARAATEVDALLDAGESVSRIARRIAERHGLGKHESYVLALARRDAREPRA